MAGRIQALVLADTHVRGDLSKLPAEVWGHVARADVVLHAGDVVTGHLLDALGERAPVHAVRWLAYFGRAVGQPVPS